MQNCLVPSPYPEKLVPPCVMNYTTSLYDILAYIQCDFVDGVLTLNYINNGTLVKLGHCKLSMRGFQCRLSDFATANLAGIDNDFKTKSVASYDIHVLQSPVKYIGKEIFGKVLQICRSKNIKSLSLLPLKFTKSPIFYEKMIDYYPHDIDNFSYDELGNMIFSLK